MIWFIFGSLLIVGGALTLAAEVRYYNRPTAIIILCVVMGAGLGLAASGISGT